jgi:GntR family transcriptional regulator
MSDKDTDRTAAMSVAERTPIAGLSGPGGIQSNASTNAAKNTGILRYYALWMTLWSRIMNGYYPPGCYIGTETEIAEQFGVSRITVRQSLDLLQRENMIDRRRGSGTFVAAHVRPHGTVEFTGFLDDIIQQADSATTTYLDREDVGASASVAKELRIDEGVQVTRLRRLRSNQGLPKLWIVNYIRREVADLLSAQDLAVVSVLGALDNHPQTRIAYGRQLIDAEIAEADIADRLQIPEGSAVLHVQRTVLSSSDYPLEYADMYYPGSRFSFSVRLGRVAEP